MNDSNVVDLPQAALAKALKQIGFDLDPEAASFEMAAARIVELAIGDEGKWLEFRQYFDEELELDRLNELEIDYPDQPGELLLAPQHVDSDLDVLNQLPTGSQSDHLESMGTVMVVDDSNVDRQFIGSTCADAGFDVLRCSQAWDALGTLEDSLIRPDLLFVDVNMPRMNGFDLVRLIRKTEAYREAFVVMMTSDSLDIWRDEMKALDGGAKFVQKPLDKSQVRILCDQHARHGQYSLHA